MICLIRRLDLLHLIFVLTSFLHKENQQGFTNTRSKHKCEQTRNLFWV